MKALHHSVLATAFAVALAGCGSDSTDVQPVGDTGALDTGGADAISVDTSTPNDTATDEDTSTADTAIDDTAIGDTAIDDTATGDTASEDAADTGDTAIDSGSSDTGSADTGVLDTGIIVDTGVLDTGIIVDTAVPGDTADAAPILAWGASCTQASTCAAPTGETGYCADGYGQPKCAHTCNAQGDYTLCEGGAGICVPGGDGNKYCQQKCGDASKTTCGAGASCAFLGYRAAGTSFAQVGVCLPDCTATGPDACTGAGTSCDVTRRTCAEVGCPGGCPTGSSCSGSTCVPTSPIAIYGSCQVQPSGVANGCPSNACFAMYSAPELGFCGAFCNTQSGETTCGAGGVCWTDNNAIPPGSAGDGGTLSFPNGSFSVVGGRTGGACLKKCNDTSECPAGFYCGQTNGVRACIPGELERPSTPAGTGLPGAACRADSQCVSGICARATAYADGVCTRASTTVPCPSGTVADATSPTICWPTCTGTGDAECPASFFCDDTATPRQCAIGLCRDDADCASGFVCDEQSSQCVTTPSTAPGGVGGACTANTSCKGGVCLTGADWPSGYCSSFCTVLPSLTDTCPNGTICTADRIGKVGVCLDLCDASTTSKFGACRSGYVCEAFTGDPRFGYCTKP